MLAGGKRRIAFDILNEVVNELVQLLRAWIGSLAESETELDIAWFLTKAVILEQGWVLIRFSFQNYVIELT